MEQTRTNTYVYGNVEIVVCRPQLDDKEHKRRLNTLRLAVEQYGKTMVRRDTGVRCEA